MKNCIIAGIGLFLVFFGTGGSLAADASMPPTAQATKVAVPKAELTAEQYEHLGNVAGREEKYKEAARQYTKAIESKPDYVRAYYNRGYAYIELRKYKLAISDLDKAIELDPDFAAAYHVRGIAYFLKKKYPKAIEDYTKALELDPDNLKFHISLMSVYFKTGNSDGAWEEVIKIQKLGGTVNPAIINVLKGKKYKDRD